MVPAGQTVGATFGPRPLQMCRYVRLNPWSRESFWRDVLYCYYELGSADQARSSRHVGLVRLR
jgi:hypothetical protein